MILLVGNKTDLKDKREVRKEDAAHYADQHQLAFIETSAMDCTNVDLAFDRIINEIYRVVANNNAAEDPMNQDIETPDKQQEKTPENKQPSILTGKNAGKSGMKLT